ncbi:MAG: hypothetical protein PUG67_01770 [Peptoniphilaceae bacterium]|nr:hypothetical protein [Peptoniphilaceae bacterium]MDY6018204.1 hypothetical protein [Anaerococcus sp.]
MKIKKILPFFGLVLVLAACSGKKTDPTSSDITQTTTIQAPTSDNANDQSLDKEDQIKIENNQSTESSEIKDSNNK